MTAKAAAAMLAVALPLSVALAAEPIVVRDAWVRATVPGQSVAGAYMELSSPLSAALIAADTPVAQKAELHTMAMEAGVMKMRPVAKIDLPARQTVSLKPGGLHVMLIGVKRELRAGERLPLTLTVQDAKGGRTTIEIEAAVRNAATADDHAMQK
jgi:periplasmic copper chaperone A